MSIDDLYGERSYIRGKISACEIKIGDLEKTVKRLEKEITELKEDVRRLKDINKKIQSAIVCLKHSIPNIERAHKSVNDYYSDSGHTWTWLSKISRVSEKANTHISRFKKIKGDSLDVIKQLNDEIRKKQNSVQEYTGTINRTKTEKRNYEDDLRRIQYEIDNYDDE